MWLFVGRGNTKGAHWAVLVFVLLCCPGSSWAQNDFWLSRRVADERTIERWVKNHQLTRNQAIALKSTLFLAMNENGGPWIDFTPDCGSEKTLLGPTSGTVAALDYLHMSIVHYPTALKAFGKWDAAAQQRVAELAQIYDTVVTLANQSASRPQLLRKARPLLEKADKISGELARGAGFGYHSSYGCGAGEDDFREVNFSFSEKPRAAY